MTVSQVTHKGGARLGVGVLCNTDAQLPPTVVRTVISSGRIPRLAIVISMGVVLTSAAPAALAQGSLVWATPHGNMPMADTPLTPPTPTAPLTASSVAVRDALRLAPPLRSTVATWTVLPTVAEVQVAWWANRYSTVFREPFVHAIVRGQPYGQMIAMKLRNAGLPGALIYLPVVESRFSEMATSHVGAVGLWQFMPGTARLYGLRVDTWVDERRDPYRETDAAVRYLRDLYTAFGDWYLALAAYNAGNDRVIRALRSSGALGNTHAFWMAQSKLPRETREYVPQLLGVARVGANPEQYGVAVPRLPPKRDLVRILLPPASCLTTLATIWGISLNDLAQLNPALNWAVTPPDREYTVVVPRANAEAKRNHFLSLPKAERVASQREITRIAQTR